MSSLRAKATAAANNKNKENDTPHRLGTLKHSAPAKIGTGHGRVANAGRVGKLDALNKKPATTTTKAIGKLLKLNDAGQAPFSLMKGVGDPSAPKRIALADRNINSQQAGVSCGTPKLEKRVTADTGLDTRVFDKQAAKPLTKPFNRNTKNNNQNQNVGTAAGRQKTVVFVDKDPQATTKPALPKDTIGDGTRVFDENKRFIDREVEFIPEATPELPFTPFLGSDDEPDFQNFDNINGKGKDKVGLDYHDLGGDEVEDGHDTDKDSILNDSNSIPISRKRLGDAIPNKLDSFLTSRKGELEFRNPQLSSIIDVSMMESIPEMPDINSLTNTPIQSQKRHLVDDAIESRVAKGKHFGMETTAAARPPITFEPVNRQKRMLKPVRPHKKPSPLNRNGKTGKGIMKSSRLFKHPGRTKASQQLVAARLESEFRDKQRCGTEDNGGLGLNTGTGKLDFSCEALDSDLDIGLHSLAKDLDCELENELRSELKNKLNKEVTFIDQSEKSIMEIEMEIGVKADRPPTQEIKSFAEEYEHEQAKKSLSSAKEVEDTQVIETQSQQDIIPAARLATSISSHLNKLKFEVLDSE